MGTISRGAKAGGGTNLNSGQTCDPAEVNTDFNTIVTEINGELDDANIKTAELPGSKSLRFTEISAPSNPSSNDVLLYALEQSGSRITTRDSSGTVYVLGTGAEIIRKTAQTQVVNNSTTLVNDDALLAALAANENIYFMAFVAHDGHENGDIKYAWTVPSGATLIWSAPNATVSTADALQGPTVVTTSGSSLNYRSVSTNGSGMLFVGTVRNGANAGNLQLQWAQNAAYAGDTYVKTNSYLLVWRE